MTGDAMEHIAMKDSRCIKCQGNDVRHGKNHLLPLYLWLQTLYFARILYVAITKHLQPHQKNVANPYCYLTTCYASQPSSYCCSNWLSHLFWAYSNDSTMKQKGKNLVVNTSGGSSAFLATALASCLLLCSLFFLCVLL
jgi:hypothetical protein